MSLKLVKNAHIENNEGMIQIRHYETIIFSFDPVSKKSISKIDLSVTSNKQIRLAIDEFKPIENQEVKPSEKWLFSGEYQN